MPAFGLEIDLNYSYRCVSSFPRTWRCRVLGVYKLITKKNCSRAFTIFLHVSDVKIQKCLEPFLHLEAAVNRFHSIGN